MTDNKNNDGTTISKITDATGDASVAELSVEKDVGGVWADSLPLGIHSNVILKNKKFILNLEEERATVLQAGGRWGLMEGDITLYLQRPQDQPSSFVLVSSVSALRMDEVFQDPSLVKEIETQLTLSNLKADLCAFRKWPGMAPDKALQIRSFRPDSSDALQVIQKLDTLLKPSQTARRTGILLAITLNLAALYSKSSGSVLKKLSDVNQLSGSPSSLTDLVLSCAVTKTVANEVDMSQPGTAVVTAASNDSQPISSLEFRATFPTLPILESAALQNVALSFSLLRTPATVTKETSLNAVLKLEGSLVLGIFNSEQPWVSVGTLLIDKANQTAEFTVAPAPQNQIMAELGAIRLQNINLKVTYYFGSSSPNPPSAVAGAGAVETKSTARCSVYFTADVTVSKYTVTAAVIFNGVKPSLLFFKILETMDIVELYQSVFGQTFQATFVLSLSGLRTWYSWNPAALILPEAPDHLQGDEARTFAPGFNATARTNILGIEFDASLNVLTSGDKGIKVTGKLIEPINLTIASLYEVGNERSGPNIMYHAKDGGPNLLTIDAGITIIDRSFPKNQLRYTKAVKDGRDCLQVNIKFDSKIVPGGSVNICLEVVKINKRTHIRLNGIPLTEILDAFGAAQFADKIREWTKKDPCGEIDLPTGLFLRNKWSVRIEFSEEQPKQVEGQPYRCSFDIAGVWTLILIAQRIVEITLDPFSLVMEIPKTWDDLLLEVAKGIGNSIDNIVQSLLANIDKFSEILSILALECAGQNWIKAALRAWLCRHKDAPVPQPEADLEPEPQDPLPDPPEPRNPLPDPPKPTCPIEDLWDRFRPGKGGVLPLSEK